MQLIQDNKTGLYERRDLGNGFVGDVPSAVTLISATPEMRWTGAKIPLAVWEQIASFFQWSQEETKSETQARILYHPESGSYKAWAFPQKYGTGMTAKDLPDDPSYVAQLNEQMAGGWIKFGTAHHHCSVGAFQSGTDSADEKEMGIHVTLGDIGKDRHSIHARVSLFLPGTLDAEGNVVAVGRHAYYLAVLSDWFSVPQVSVALPPEINEKITEWVLTTPVDGVGFPEQWAKNLIKDTPKVVTGFSYQGGRGGGEDYHRWDSIMGPIGGGQHHDEVVAASPALPPVRDIDDVEYDERIDRVMEELDEVMTRSTFSFARIHGIMSCPARFDIDLDPAEEVVRGEVEDILRKNEICWDEYTYDAVY